MPPKRQRPRSSLNVAFIYAGNDLLSHTLSRAVQSARRGLTSVFGMGTGGSPAVRSPTKQLAISRQHLVNSCWITKCQLPSADSQRSKINDLSQLNRLGVAYSLFFVYFPISTTLQRLGLFHKARRRTVVSILHSHPSKFGGSGETCFQTQLRF
jgi:hypothetical protein